jgi:hypothetical protein
MRGPLLFERHLVWRGLRLWLLARLALLAVVMLAAALQGGPLIDTTRGSSLAIVVVTILLGTVEAWRVSERVFLANLGVSVGAQLVLLAAGAVAGEVLLMTTIRLL